jgi:hypothetical protein
MPFVPAKIQLIVTVIAWQICAAFSIRVTFVAWVITGTLTCTVLIGFDAWRAGMRFNAD